MPPIEFVIPPISNDALMRRMAKISSMLPRWHYQAAGFEKAKRIAADTGTSILLAFTGLTWCGPCQNLHREVLSTIGFRFWALTHNLTLVDIDIPADANAMDPADVLLCDQYNVTGLPTALRVDSTGDEFGRVVGYAAGSSALWMRDFEMATGITLYPMLPHPKLTRKSAA